MSKEKNNKPQAGRGPMGAGGQFSGEKPKNFKKTFGKLLDYIKPFIPKIVLVMGFSMLSVIFNVLAPTYLGEGINIVADGYMEKINTGQGGIDFDALKNIVITLVVIYLLSVIFLLISNLLISSVSQKISYKLRNQISEKLNLLPLKYFDKNPFGDIMSRVTNDIDTISQTLNQGLSEMISAISTIIGILVMMIRISPLMTLVNLLILPLYAIIVMIVIKFSQKYFRQQQEFLGEVNSQVEETFSGHTVVKSFNNEEKILQKFSVANEKLYKTSWKSQFISGIMQPALGFVGNLGYVCVCVLGGYLGITGKIKVGSITSFIQYVRRFNQPISQISQISNVLQSTIAAAERVFALLEEENEIDNVKNPVSAKDIKGNIEFRNVNFGYEKDKTVINNFSASIERGKNIAIVGPTGAGKTTIVKLLMRFYELNGGEIKIDGHNINDFERRDLRSLFSMVLQDAWLFNGTIKENIRYGNLNATDEDIINACKATNVHRLIKTLPDGYDTVLNEEVSNISQGQKQLLTIARAILADPEILILDEATSSVDTRTEVLIQQGMAKLAKGRTSFVIAHRLSTIRDSDLILVMKDGDIIEQGNHEDLLKSKGFYYDLYNNQFETA